MLKQDVLILVDKGNRDALGLLLVYAHLRFVHKLRVKIESAIFMTRFWAALYRPTVVIYISADCPAAISVYEYLHQMGCKKLMYFTEVIVARYTECLFVGKYDYKTKIDYVLLPSEGMKELLIRNGKIDEHQAYLVGNPVFDWCVPPLNEHFIHREEFAEKYRLPQDRKWILLATSFDWADLDMINYERDYFHIPASKEMLASYQHKYSMLRNKVIECVTEVLEKHPEWHLLIKCHPMESQTVYNRVWSNHPQVTHVHGEDIYELLANSDVLIHWHSTTSIQAWGFGKPTVHLDPCDMDDLFKEDNRVFRDSNYVCHNAIELEAALADCLSSVELPTAQLESREQFIDEWCYRLDGKSASRLADVVAAFATQSGTRPVRSIFSFREWVRNFQLVGRVFFTLYRAKIHERLGLGSYDLSAYPGLDEFLLIRSLRRKLSPFLKGMLGNGSYPGGHNTGDPGASRESIGKGAGHQADAR